MMMDLLVDFLSCSLCSTRFVFLRGVISQATQFFLRRNGEGREIGALGRRRRFFTKRRARGVPPISRVMIVLGIIGTSAASSSHVQ